MPRRTVFVANLPYDTSEEKLLSLFQPHGATEALMRPGYGYASIEIDSKSVEAAVAQLNRLEIDGHRLSVSAFVNPRGDRE